MSVIAEIIVDVPAMQTDQPYSYIVPTELENLIEVGMRVEVPFGNGNRRIQGFVVGFSTETPEIDELKPIASVLDLSLIHI